MNNQKDSLVQCALGPRPTRHLARFSGPPLRARATLGEVFATCPTDAAVMGFVGAQLPVGGAPVLWVQDRLTAREAGVPYLHGVSRKLQAGRLIRVDVSRAADVLWALEQGLRCPALGAVVGEIWGDPGALDFTATKRLVMRAERMGVPCWLIRRAAQADLSAARQRWRVGALPAVAHPHDAQAPGDARWQAELFRARDRAPGTWVGRYERAADRVDFTAPFRYRAVAEAAEPSRQRARG